MRILLIEDDQTISQNICFVLKHEGMITDDTFTGEDALEALKINEYDLIILDLGLPDMDGYEVLKRLRGSHIQTPVLILSGFAAPEKKIRGLGFGADDYLTKPFDQGELIARVNALVRRANGYADSVINIGDLEINLTRKIAKVKGQELPLTSKEYAIVELLALKNGTTVSKEQFLNNLYGGMDEPEIKIIDVFLCKIRKKFEEYGIPDYIQTIWGKGYILREPPEDDF